MIETSFSILGSLGLFLFGMKLMSENIQKVAGDNLRNAIRSLTHNRFLSLLSGTLITIAIQSSSATTVMIVSFVNAGLMRLREAIGMIMGANLGTTATFWIVAFVGFKFSLSTIALPAIGIGVVMFFLRSTKTQDTGQALIGFGLLFLGLQFLKNNVPDVKNNPEVFSFVQHFTELGFVSVPVFLAFGVLLTIVVQSSSVAGAITLALATKGWINFDMAAAIILGENIGTTITAIIASLGANRNAKRAALAHLTFNLMGVVWMLIVFHPFLLMVDWLMPGDPWSAFGTNQSDVLPKHMALFHTLFNLCNIALLIGFLSRIESIVTKILPEKEDERSADDRLIYITNRLAELGELNLMEGQQQVGRLASIADEMFSGFTRIYENPEEDLSFDVKRLKKLEKESDRLDEEIAHYFVQCSRHELSQSSANNVTALLRVSSELEEICDHCHRLILLARRRYRKELDLSKETQNSIMLYSKQVQQCINYVQQCLKNELEGCDLKMAKQLEKGIVQSRKALRKAMIEKMEQEGDIKGGLITIDIVSHFEKIGNHSLNILESLDTSYERSIESVPVSSSA